MNMEWSQMGNILGATLKSPEELVILDPRDDDSIVRAPTSLLSRGCKLQWIDDDNILLTGFNQNNARAWSIIDLRNPGAPLSSGTLNPGVNNCFPYFDPTLGYFVLAGRGDQNIEFYTVNTSETKMVDKLGEYKFNDTNVLFTMMHKSVVDCNLNELGRAVRVGQKKTCETFSLSIPSKQGGFNSEYYPPFLSNEKVNTAEEWIGGKDVDPKTIQLEPKKVEKKSIGKLGGLGKNKAAAAASEETKQTEDPSALKQ